MAAIKTFRELDVYRLSAEASSRVFQMTKTFPREEMYSLTDQVRRSARAVCAMIAEGWGRRRYRAVFINKLDEAIGETHESQAWMDAARSSGYINAATHKELDALFQRIGAMLNRMIDRADDFCKFASDTDYRTKQAVGSESPNDNIESRLTSHQSRGGRGNG
jgi:four helix bundle protein